MVARSFWYLTIFFIFLLPIKVFADDTQNYRQYILEIEQRLDTAATLYQQNHTDEARRKVQMAYFEIFENLEGPIRINISAKKSYQMEAMFGTIRKMMNEKMPEDQVLAKIQQLKQDIQAVLPNLENGHTLEGESSHNVYAQTNIAMHWQQSFKAIDDNFANMLSAYQQDDFKAAKNFAQKAQYDGYKNSEMEMSVRMNRSAKISGEINQRFYNLIKLSEKPNNLNELAYQTTLLLQDIEDLLPNLPTTREEQNNLADNDSFAETGTGISNDRKDINWSQISNDINQQIQQAIQTYQQGDTQKAMLNVQDIYFDVFENSGFEAKIGSRDNQFKAQLEGYFTKLVSLMKAKADVDEIQIQAEGLKVGMAKAVNMLQGSIQDNWSLFLYSLLIILREGLEALLIVAAIVTYLVKNHHQDKLPVIRQSVYVALGASLVTAVIFQLIFSNAGASRELLEGFTMIFAVIMLFTMSYWLFSKVEANNWKLYLEGKLSFALTTGSLVGLWLTSFLAVYREGAETVLFYYALAADAQTTMGIIYLIAGFVVGAILLAICYFIMRYSVVKLPLKPFFMLTGSFMYFMAFVFAGKSVLELIEGKLFEPTLLPHLPEIPWLGIYPYVQTLVPQIILVIAAIFAFFYMKRQSRNAC